MSAIRRRGSGRRGLPKWIALMAVLLLVVSACGDDDTAATTSAAVVATTAAPAAAATTGAPATTAAPEPLSMEQMPMEDLYQLARGGRGHHLRWIERHAGRVPGLCGAVPRHRG